VVAGAETGAECCRNRSLPVSFRLVACSVAWHQIHRSHDLSSKAQERGAFSAVLTVSQSTKVCDAVHMVKLKLVEGANNHTAELGFEINLNRLCLGGSWCEHCAWNAADTAQDCVRITTGSCT
jgi:hypothetical protein